MLHRKISSQLTINENDMNLRIYWNDDNKCHFVAWIREWMRMFGMQMKSLRIIKSPEIFLNLHGFECSAESESTGWSSKGRWWSARGTTTANDWKLRLAEAKPHENSLASLWITKFTSAVLIKWYDLISVTIEIPSGSFHRFYYWIKCVGIRWDRRRILRSLLCGFSIIFVIYIAFPFLFSCLSLHPLRYKDERTLLEEITRSSLSQRSEKLVGN